MSGRSRRPRGLSDVKWLLPAQFEVVDRHLDIRPGAVLEMVDDMWASGPVVEAVVVELVGAAERSQERLVVLVGGERLELTRLYGWSGPEPGVSKAFVPGRRHQVVAVAADGGRRQMQVVVPR